MKGIIVKQYINDVWVTLIEVPTKVPEDEVPPEAIEESLKEMRNLIFDHDKVQIYTETEAVIFIRQAGPVKLSWGDIGNVGNN